MYVFNWNVNVVEELSVVLDRVASGEEHHALLVFVLLDKGEKEHKTLVTRTHYISLME